MNAPPNPLIPFAGFDVRRSRLPSAIRLTVRANIEIDEFAWANGMFVEKCETKKKQTRLGGEACS